MAWFYLICAGLCEVLFVTMMKLSNNFSRPWPIAVIVISIAISFIFLSKAMSTIPISSAYAIWVGIGVVGAVIIDYFFFKQNINAWQLFFIVTLLMSTIGLKVNS